MNHLTQAGLIKEHKHNQLKAHLNSVYGAAVQIDDTPAQINIESQWLDYLENIIIDNNE